MRGHRVTAAPPVREFRLSRAQLQRLRPPSERLALAGCDISVKLTVSAAGLTVAVESAHGDRRASREQRDTACAAAVEFAKRVMARFERTTSAPCLQEEELQEETLGRDIAALYLRMRPAGGQALEPPETKHGCQLARADTRTGPHA